MRTRWDEVEENEGGSSRFLGFSAVTWGIAVPVAFIAGAAVMSYFDQSRSDTAPLAIPAPVDRVNQGEVAERGSVAEKSRWEEEARNAAAKAAELQMQVEALRDEVSDEARRRRQAEQAAAEKASELDRMQQGAEAAPTAAVAISSAVQPEPNALSYSAPSSGTTSRGQAVIGEQLNSSTTSGAGPQNRATSDDSIALQRIIEDTASRSAALSDRREEMEADTVASNTGASSARVARTATQVETALGRATGLDTLSASQRSGLKDELVAGACVTVSLEKVFGNPVPVVPLRNLVRDLDSDC